MVFETLLRRARGQALRPARGIGRADVAIAVGLLVLEVLVLVIGDSDRPDAERGPLAVALAILASLPLVLRRVRPGFVFVVVAAAVCLGLALDTSSAGLGIVAALYAIAVYGDRRGSVLALVFSVVVQVAVYFVLPQEAEGSEFVLQLVTSAIAIAAFWALGAYVGTRRAYVAELEDRAERLERERTRDARLVRAEERTRIARELHDVVAHTVSTMLVGARGARDSLRSRPDLADAALAQVEDQGERSLAELRRMLGVLREHDEGAEMRPSPRVDELAALVERYRQAGLPVSLEVTGAPRRLPDGVELSAYRIVQEALTNALKHAQPRRVLVRLGHVDQGLRVEVTDDGAASGRDTNGAGGHGIVGMRERATALGGTLEAGPALGRGFRVAAFLPAPAEP